MTRRFWAAALVAVAACATPEATQKSDGAQKLPQKQRLLRERTELEAKASRGADPTLQRELGWALLVEGHW